MNYISMKLRNLNNKCKESFLNPLSCYKSDIYCWQIFFFERFSKASICLSLCFWMHFISLSFSAISPSISSFSFLEEQIWDKSFRKDFLSLTSSSTEINKASYVIFIEFFFYSYIHRICPVLWVSASLFSPKSPLEKAMVVFFLCKPSNELNLSCPLLLYLKCKCCERKSYLLISKDRQS